VIGAHLASEQGFHFSDWLVFLEGEKEIESLTTGEKLEGEIYELERPSSRSYLEISVEDTIQPEIYFNLFGIDLNIPESMVPNDLSESGMRASSLSDAALIWI